MNRRFELSWDAIPHDGTSTPIGYSSTYARGDSEELYQAWCRERHETIELRLSLDKALKLLERVLAEGGVTPSNKRRVRRLIMSIKAADQGEHDRSV